MPGVGPRSAQRMAFHLLERDREGAHLLCKTLDRALAAVRKCGRCNNFSEQELCTICSSSRRDHTQLCVVESPADVEALEKAGVYNGLYFVLMGHLSPIDGIGVEELGIDQFKVLLEGNSIAEVIVATNPTTEGEATAHVIGELVRKHKIRASRIAHGVPVGSELEYLDGGTLEHAFKGRHEL